MNSPHPESADGPLIFIAAAEPSADAHAADLIREATALRPGIRFAGVAGPAMKAAGCWAIFDMTRHSAMLLGALKVVGPALKLLSTTKRHLAKYPFQAVVVVDSPTLNLPIAKRAKRHNLPVLYFIAPQLWAWGKYRIRKVRARVDRMAVILPFEEQYFRTRGVDATYVGHPLFERLADQPPDAEAVAAIRAKGQPVLAVLPGSRRHVVAEVLPGQLEVAGRLIERFSRLHVGVSVANPQVAPVIEAILGQSGVEASCYVDRNADLLTAADLALVASGTATLEVAYRHTPMIVMYNASRWFYHLVARWLISTRHLSLINILADRQIVPEFMPYYRSIDPIAEQAATLLADADARRKMSDELAALLDPLVKTGAAKNAAKILLEMLDAPSPQRGHSARCHPSAVV